MRHQRKPHRGQYLPESRRRSQAGPAGCYARLPLRNAMRTINYIGRQSVCRQSARVQRAGANRGTAFLGRCKQW